MDVFEQLIAAKSAANRGHDTQAEKLFAALIEEHPDSASARWEFGRYHGLRCNYKEAREHFSRAVELDPNYASVEFKAKGHTIRLRDYPGSPSAAHVLGELADNPYGIFDTIFRPGDVIVDVGGHIGMISIILAKMHPRTRIITFEPASNTFERLVNNLEANQTTNVTAVRAAVDGIGGRRDLIWSAHETSSSTMHVGGIDMVGRTQETIECRTLDSIFEEFEIDRCAWLKLDCEGAEYSIFQNTRVFDKVDQIAMEVHYPLQKHESVFMDLVKSIEDRGDRIPPTLISSCVATIYDFPVAFSRTAISGQ